MHDSSRTRRVRSWGRQVLLAHVLGGVALAGCGGKVGTLHRDEPRQGATGGAAGSSGESGGSAAGGMVTASGGAASPQNDDDDDQVATTDDACPCPIQQITPDAAGGLVHFESLACYCSSTECPSTRGEAGRDLCERVAAVGSGEVVRGVGCGLARVSLTRGTFSLDWVFEEGPPPLIGAAVWSDSPGGLCSAQNYLYGELYACQGEKVCHICGDNRLGLPACPTPL